MQLFVDIKINEPVDYYDNQKRNKQTNKPTLHCDL